MDSTDFTTTTVKRKKGSHLTDIERGMIQALSRCRGANGKTMSLREIAARVGCAHTTVQNELRRGTLKRKGRRGRPPSYSAKLGARVYKRNRKSCKRKLRITLCQKFVGWCVKQFFEKHWSLDACVGYARRNKIFSKAEMVCTRTLYNAVRAGLLDVALLDLPEAASRKPKGADNMTSAKRKRMYGEGISARPEIVNKRVQFGHWEGDTVVGKRGAEESLALTMVEKMTEDYIAIKIKNKTSEAVMAAIEQLRKHYGAEKFAEIFKTITVDNGSEFADLASIENWGTKVYYANPYSSWERAQNERHNRILRRYLPKGRSMNEITADDVLYAVDIINALPRKALNYQTPEALFENQLDIIYRRTA